jgi:hypothetical protein
LQEKQTKFEDENCGDYEKIFPLAIQRASAMYAQAQVDATLSSADKQAASQ